MSPYERHHSLRLSLSSGLQRKLYFLDSFVKYMAPLTTFISIQLHWCLLEFKKKRFKKGFLREVGLKLIVVVGFS